MPELTPEERQRIYAEEKARLEIRRELEGKKTSLGKIVGIVALCGFGVLILLIVLAATVQKNEEEAFKKLTPQQRHQRTLESCSHLLKSMEFKTYSELSVEERKAKVACTEQLENPDQEIIRPSQ